MLTAAAVAKTLKVSFLTRNSFSAVFKAAVFRAITNMKDMNKGPNMFSVVLSYVFANFKAFECPKDVTGNCVDNLKNRKVNPSAIEKKLENIRNDIKK